MYYSYGMLSELLLINKLMSVFDGKLNVKILLINHICHLQLSISNGSVHIEALAVTPRHIHSALCTADCRVVLTDE